MYRKLQLRQRDTSTGANASDAKESKAKGYRYGTKLVQKVPFHVRNSIIVKVIVTSSFKATRADRSARINGPRTTVN